MKRPDLPKPTEEMTPEEFAAYDDALFAWQNAQRAKIAELQECEAKLRTLLEEVFDEGTFGLTPELYVEALRLRKEMNDRQEYLEGRKLFLPAGTPFAGPRLAGFDVVVVNKPIAIGAGDFANYKSFSITPAGRK